jgi:peptide/nickel transport system permease protein
MPASLVLGGSVVALLVIVAALSPVLAPHSPTSGSITQRLWDVGTVGHLLGTDGQGRDILSRLIWGARPTLIAGVVPVVLAAIVGTALGIVAGLARPLGRNAVMRTLDVLYSFPAVLLAIAIAAALGPGIENAILSLAIVLIAPIARVVEGEVLGLRTTDFMDAARVSGAGWPTICMRHVLPNIAPPLLVYSTLLVGQAIVYAAGLSLLGLGVVPPDPDWGQMVNDLRQSLYDRPLLSLAPAIAIFVASAAFNVLGRGLQLLFDIREDVRP